MRHCRTFILAIYAAMPQNSGALIVPTKTYAKAAGKLFNAAERAATENEIAANPFAWPVIRGTGGIRKARAAAGGKGKSGGVRVIYFYLASPETIYLLTAYPKTRQEDLSADDRKAWAKYVRELTGGE